MNLYKTYYFWLDVQREMRADCSMIAAISAIFERRTNDNILAIRDGASELITLCNEVIGDRQV